MSEKNLKQAALDYHRYPFPGKTEVVPTKPYNTPEDLALAYSPGVAYPCLEIKDNENKIFDYTNKGNLIAVISNGTVAHGLGNILPKPFDRRLLTVVAPAVIEAAEESGVATRRVDYMDGYRQKLEQIICTNDALIAYLIKIQSTCNIK